MWSMISWRVTAIGRWAERLSVRYQLKRNVIDLSHHEGGLYRAFTHLDHHVRPAINEWDSVLDRMPDD